MRGFKVEEHLEEMLTFYVAELRFGDYTPELIELAEWYRDGLMQYRMLHDPVLTILVPRFSLIYNVDFGKVKGEAFER